MEGSTLAGKSTQRGYYLGPGPLQVFVEHPEPPSRFLDVGDPLPATIWTVVQTESDPALGVQGLDAPGTDLGRALARQAKALEPATPTWLSETRH